MANDEDISNDEYDYEGEESSGEPIAEKPTIDKFYDTEEILYNIEMTFRGYQKKQKKWVYVTLPIARDEFINMTINSLRSVVNPENIITKKSDEDIEIILLEKNLEFIDICEDEATLEDRYIENVINTYDHTLELFMGLVSKGHGADTLKQIYAGVARGFDDFHDKREDSLLRLNVEDKEIINIGRR